MPLSPPPFQSRSSSRRSASAVSMSVTSDGDKGEFGTEQHTPENENAGDHSGSRGVRDARAPTVGMPMNDPSSRKIRHAASAPQSPRSARRRHARIAQPKPRQH